MANKAGKFSPVDLKNKILSSENLNIFVYKAPECLQWHSLCTCHCLNSVAEVNKIKFIWSALILIFLNF